jgi:hypothetical protein
MENNLSNIKEEITNQVKQLSESNGGLSEALRKEIVHMVYVGYLDGHTGGVKFAQDCLEETYNSK